ncbi:MAG: AmmeMemoRadiSam system radical SAM enzyme [Deltaproteobacteria bacterium]|nr:MAG: AmmeMemoRadiSam system radical SAM enzyme [Deltaproteobacteria bacterium]
MKACLYDTTDGRKVKCHLCHHRCSINVGRRGLCGVRENRQGVLRSLVYGKVIARHVDPIEKKPFFHFLPGSRAYSIATVGCNFTCRFCQNADIAQMPADRRGVIAGSPASAEEEVAAATAAGCRSIAYTYTEPTVFFEFACDTARLAHGRGIRNVFVTNGYMTPEALEMISPFLDAANVDLKAFNDDFYKKMCGARLAPVLKTLKEMKTRGIFVEVTTLLIPGLNDDPDELKALAAFIANDLGVETPWHISRFHPTYRLTDRPATPVDSLITARETGKKAGLQYVYTGNVPGQGGEQTVCHQCGRVIIDRWGFSIRSYAVENGCCRYCGTPVAGIGM